MLSGGSKRVITFPETSPNWILRSWQIPWENFPAAGAWGGGGLVVHIYVHYQIWFCRHIRMWLMQCDQPMVCPPTSDTWPEAAIVIKRGGLVTSPVLLFSCILPSCSFFPSIPFLLAKATAPTPKGGSRTDWERVGSLLSIFPFPFPIPSLSPFSFSQSLSTPSLSFLPLPHPSLELLSP